MKSIPLTKGQFALVDDADFPWLSRLRWCYSSAGYAVNYYADEYGIYHKRSMHRMVMTQMRPLVSGLAKAVG